MRVLSLVVACVVLLVLTPFVGGSLEWDSASWVMLQLRLPRVVLGALVGATLGIVGAAFQAVFENPLATPSTIGTTAGASLGALAVLVLVPVGVSIGTPMVAAGAFVGALVASFGVATLAAVRQLRTDELLLAGIAVTLAAGAITTGLQVAADSAATFQAVRWSLGSLSVVGYRSVLVLAPVSVVTIVVILLQSRALEAMVAGQDLAATQGVNVTSTRTISLGVGALGVAACVAAAGPIAFVGLLVPHLVRLVVGASRRKLLPLSAVVGASLLPVADALARVVLPGQELPVGVLTAALGAPLLLALLVRRKR
ncbi:MAG: ABC-type Fe3+-siderophore transport system permease subunit [Kiritimatiellia bacterium]|jgi:ABC-type Fe3+-siderophore transport system permease subunit